MTKIVFPYKPRKPFLPLHDFKGREAVVVAHRRAGKTVACVMQLIMGVLSCQRPMPKFAYIAPYYAQAKDIAWAYIKKYSSVVPGVTFHEGELRANFPNGGMIRLYGADNAERLRGNYFDGVVADEFGDWRPAVWPEVVAPALTDRQGWAIKIGTPKGDNQFKSDYYAAVRDESKLALMLPASTTGILPREELERLRAEPSMTASRYAREFECSFDAMVEGVYYASQLETARKEGRIGFVGEEPILPKKAFWDLGYRDSTAIWIAQHLASEIRVLDFIQGVGQEIGYYIGKLHERGHGRAVMVLPHDGAQNRITSPGSAESLLRRAGFRVQVVPNQGRGAAMQRIEASRRLFPIMRFHEENCREGLRALAHYHEHWDDVRNCGVGPRHDWASDAADAFGLIAITYKQPSNEKFKELPVTETGWMI